MHFLFKASLLVGGVVALAVIAGLLYLRQDKFGRLPEGDRLARIGGSANYRDGQFHNQVPIVRIVTGNSGLSAWIEFLFNKKSDTVPPAPVPAVKTDLKALGKDRDVVVWLGHSSYFVRMGGKTLLVDPVFSANASPVPLTTRAFDGTSIYTADDMPPIDILLISHDHWDHLDHDTLTALRPRIGKVVTGLGVGEHLARWGFPEGMVREADWGDAVDCGDGLTVHVLTARHFSGRMLQRNRTLWASFAIETRERRIYYSGGSGYGPHFKAIGETFGGFDLVLLDSGQYDPSWPDVHMTPEQAARAAQDLGARAALPSHAGKFSISYHAWDDPFVRFAAASAGKPYRLATPRIGEVVDLADDGQRFTAWWETLGPTTARSGPGGAQGRTATGG